MGVVDFFNLGFFSSIWSDLFGKIFFAQRLQYRPFGADRDSECGLKNNPNSRRRASSTTIFWRWIQEMFQKYLTIGETMGFGRSVLKKVENPKLGSPKYIEEILNLIFNTLLNQVLWKNKYIWILTTSLSEWLQKSRKSSSLPPEDSKTCWNNV